MNSSVEPSPESACPFAQSVRDLCTGRLAEDARIASLEEHLTDCPSCSALIDALIEPSDGIIQSLSSLPPGEEDEPEYRRLAARLLTATPGGTGSTAFVPLRLADPPLGPLPQTLGNYELLACVGRGAWGAAYQARHVKLEQIVAVKVLDSSRLQSSQAVERFLQEMKAAGQLNHPNIVRATDASEDRGFHYLVMEYVDGLDAGRLLQRSGPLAVADACEIVRQAAAALEFAHRSSWVHRDVKPSNLMVARDGVVKLLDLGVAGRNSEAAPLHDADATEHVRQSALGTADYMAPEQWTNFAEVDARADVFSLGCTLFRLLTGALPFASGAKVPPIATAEVTAPTLAAHRADLPRGLDRFVGRMLARNADERVRSAAEVERELTRWSRRAHLPALVAKASGGEAWKGVAPHSVWPISRRQLLVGGAAAAVGAFGLRWALAPAAPRLRRNEWRDLAPVSPGMLLAVEPDAQITLGSQKPPRITVRSGDLALVHMGRSVSGVFSLEVTLRPVDSPAGPGVFFQGRYLESRPNVYEFQSIALDPLNPSRHSPVRHLFWSRCELIDEDGKLSVNREPWAEAEVELADGGKEQKLQVTLGRRGFPEVRWNGRSLTESDWKLSAAGRRQVSQTPAEVQRQNLGRLGLVNSGGTTLFLFPRLAYR